MTKRVCLILAISFGVCALAAGCFLFANRPPAASAVVHYNVVEGDPMVVELDASASTDPDGDAITRYSWSFSDDLEIIAPAAYTATIPYPKLRVRCPSEGEYSATLVVWDERGASSDPLPNVLVIVPQPLPSP